MIPITVSETRRITFATDELAKSFVIEEIAAVACLNGKPPFSAVTDAGRQSLKVQSLGANDQSGPAVLDETRLCAVLLRICVALKVPVPKAATKHVECTRDGVTLILALKSRKTLARRQSETVRMTWR